MTNSSASTGSGAATLSTGVPPTPLEELPEGDRLCVLILPDLHIPSASVQQKQMLLDNRALLNQFDWIVLLGDMTNCYGTPREYEHVSRFIGELGRPYSVVNGNHEFVFAPMADDALDFGSKWEHGTVEQQRSQLNRFNAFYGFETCYRAVRHQLAGLFLLGLDGIGPDDSGLMSNQHQEWLGQSLATMRDLPVLVFCHFPIQDGRLDQIRYYQPGRRPYFQPSSALQNELRIRTKPTFWFSGHLHFGPTHPLAMPYLSELGVWQIHCPDARGYGRPDNRNWTPERYDGLFVRTLQLEAGKLSVITIDLKSNSECERVDFDLRLPSQDCLVSSTSLKQK